MDSFQLDDKEKSPLKNKGLLGLVIVAVICLVLAIAVVILAIALVSRSDSASNSSSKPSTGSSKSWRDAAKIKGATCPKQWNPLPLLLISLDGFRADYLLRHRTSAIQTLIDNGVHSPFMYPSYPSKTFPNHYAIVTGLYPQNHGIVDNNMFDNTITPASDQYFTLAGKASKNPQWWLGEPIWNTVMKNGKKAATYFWPGSDVKIQGMYPTYYEPYNKSIPFGDRVTKIVEWLMLPDGERPDFLTLYFSQPDHNGHSFGPFSSQVNDQLTVVDSMIDSLMTKLYEEGLFHCLNTVIVSDHGMAQVTRNISVADYYDKLSNYNTTKVFSGPVGRIMIQPGGPTSDEIVDHLKCQDPKFRVYAKKNIPKRVHYTNSSRIGDVIVDSDEGCLVFRSKGYPIMGQHGYDFRDNSMHALFLGFGPDLRKGMTAAPFQNIQLYNFMADLMKLKTRASTDGTLASLGNLMVNGPMWSVPVNSAPSACPIQRGNWNSCPSCSVGPISIPSSCQSWTAMSVTSSSSTFCGVSLCPIQGLFDSTASMARVVSGVINPKTTFKLTKSCTIVDSNMNSCSSLTSLTANLGGLGMSLYSLLSYSEQSSVEHVLYTRVPMYDSFYSNAWSWLGNLTATYSSKYGKLVVINGPVFDADLNDKTDSNVTQSTVPTHMFSILVRCDNYWDASGVCSGGMHTLSFVLPHESSVVNCESPHDYLYQHTARVEDIHKLTGLNFFAHVPGDQARYLYNHVNQQLWVL